MSGAAARGRCAPIAAVGWTTHDASWHADPGAELILKAQIHAGGRGKGSFDNGYKGGVKIFDT